VSSRHTRILDNFIVVKSKCPFEKIIYHATSMREKTIIMHNKATLVDALEHDKNEINYDIQLHTTSMQLHNLITGQLLGQTTTTVYPYATNQHN
jgi:hypothetical protein